MDNGLDKDSENLNDPKELERNEKEEELLSRSDKNQQTSLEDFFDENQKQNENDEPIAFENKGNDKANITSSQFSKRKNDILEESKRIVEDIEKNEDRPQSGHLYKQNEKNVEKSSSERAIKDDLENLSNKTRTKSGDEDLQQNQNKTNVNYKNNQEGTFEQNIRSAKSRGEIDEELELDPEQKKLIQMYMGQMKGLKAIGWDIRRDPRSFKNKLTSLGIKIPFPGSIWKKMIDHYTGNFNIKHKGSLKGIITGSVLGDAQIRLQSRTKPNLREFNLSKYEKLISQINSIRSIVNKGQLLKKSHIDIWNHAIPYVRKLNTANFRLHKSIFEIEWVKLLAKEFENEGYNVRTYVKVVKNPPRENQKFRWTCGFDTSSSIQLFDRWLNWYEFSPKKIKKVVPNELPRLTPNALLHWYIGDGYFGGKSKTIELYTYSFSLKENQRLVNKLKEINIQAKIINQDSNPNNYFIRLSANKEDRNEFFDFVSQAKYNNQAREIFPHKFDNTILRKDIVKKLKKDHPEYFDENSELKWEDFED